MIYYRLYVQGKWRIEQWVISNEINVNTNIMQLSIPVYLYNFIININSKSSSIEDSLMTFGCSSIKSSLTKELEHYTEAKYCNDVIK